MGKYILSHDIGTTGSKAALFSFDGKLISSNYIPYETFYPKPIWAEQKPSDWWEAFCTNTKNLIERTNISAKDIECVSFSGQMMGAVPVDKNGTLLRENVLIWSDGRCNKQAENLLDELDGWKNFFKITGGGQAIVNYSISKIMWYKENEPDIYNKAYKFLHTKDFIINRLTGNFCNDYTDASNSGYLDIKKRKYSKEILKAVDISEDKLPELYESIDVVGKVTKKAANATGLFEGLPVVEGAGDVSAATFGAGVIDEGVGYLYIGSANWTGVYTKEPIMDQETRIVNLCHVIPDVYAPHHTAYTGGIAQQWYKDTFCEIEKFSAEKANINVYDILNLKASEIKAGSGNLIFLPYLRGGGAPYHNPDSRGVFIGLNLSTKKEHLFRSILEGVAINFRLMIDNFERKNVRIKEFRAIGGGALSELWLQIYSDILDKRIIRSSYLQEANTLGAAVAGGIGVGIYKNEGILRKILKEKDVFVPNSESVNKYNKIVPIFVKAYKSLTDIFGELSQAGD